MQTSLLGDEQRIIKDVYRQLSSCLPNDFYVWHAVEATRLPGVADFVVLHPVYGLWVLSAETWSLKEIWKMGDRQGEVVAAGKKIVVHNPIARAYEQALALKSELSRIAALRRVSDAHPNRLLFAVHHLAVLPNINLRELQQSAFRKNLPDHQTIGSEFFRTEGKSLDYLATEFLEKRNLLVRFMNTYGLNDEQMAALDETLSSRKEVPRKEKDRHTEEPQMGAGVALVPDKVGNAMDIAMLETLGYIVRENRQILNRIWKRS